MYNANTDAQWVREAERACLGVFGGMAMVFGSSLRLHSFWGISVSAFALIIAAIAFWLSFRLRAIRRMFDSKGPQYFSDFKREDSTEPQTLIIR